MPKKPPISLLTQASLCLARESSRTCMRAAIRSASFHQIMDSEFRLALALEAFGEVLRDGDLDRAAAALAELEVEQGEKQRRKARHEVVDPIKEREQYRRWRRRLAKKERELARLETEGASRQTIREVRQEIEVLRGLTK